MFIIMLYFLMSKQGTLLSWLKILTLNHVICFFFFFFYLFIFCNEIKDFVLVFVSSMMVKILLDFLFV